MLQLLSYRLAEKGTPQAMANTVWAFAKMGVRHFAYLQSS